MGPLVCAGLFYVWNLQASLRLAYRGALGPGGDPLPAHVLGNFVLLATVTAVAFTRAEAWHLARPWWLLAATLGLTSGHCAAIAWSEQLGTTRRERSEA
ncbi:hypothetical protein [Nannocystis punicea]|uniref:Uncharacterized protein n=1 Tax=Nannocystis punicea TaxID=2995304 RepID=A0ABY7HHI2_9BACT|nr:hypothetical protein [Nannocystis poenicansa]WAS98766.1 hypothetical protein O0S08_21755 [Nannocystis poenicansa]